jgi:hypothetical protein
MTVFAQRVTTIKGLSDKRRLPRLGIIRLGIKRKTAKGVEYPAETEYFVVPDEVKKVYGETPTELDVMLPLNELDAVFPCAYKHYGSGKGLKCTGDGEKAWRVNADTKEMEEIQCPCKLLDEKKCHQSGTLNVILPKINVGGVYQIRTGSFNSIVDINSGIDYIKALVGRVAMVPLKLRRDKTETHHDDKKQSHFTLKLIMDANIDTINQLRTDNVRILEYSSHIALPPPKDDNPELDPVDVIDDVPVDALPEPEPSMPPAEEVTPQGNVESQEPLPDTPSPTLITANQRKRFYAIAKGSGKSDEQIKEFLKANIGSESTGDIQKGVYEYLCNEVVK